MKYFCVTDVHSFFNEMIDALHSNGFDESNPNHTLIICGDIFDRGTQSRQMFDYLSHLERFIFVRGNHEDLLQECINDLSTENFSTLQYYHFQNRTINTLADLIGMTIYDLVFPEVVTMACHEGRKVLDWIDKKSINYFEVGDFIFVHGWIPIIEIRQNKMSGLATDCYFNPNWREATNDEWARARWLNGMEMWYNNFVEKGKTIVCGHWHTSFGNGTIAQGGPEFPRKGEEVNKDLFRPFIRKNIIALDGCIPLTKMVNCLVVEIDDNGKTVWSNMELK